MIPVTVWPRREVRGWNGDPREFNGPDAITAFETLDLWEALEAVYSGDAHFVPYYVAAGDAPNEVHGAIPRINKVALPKLHEQGLEVWFRCLVLDVDAPAAMKAATPKRREALLKRWRQSQRQALADGAPELARVFSRYETRGGYRLVATLAEPVPALELEGLVADVRSYLIGATGGAVRADAACGDWTRCYRLPNVKRDGEPQRSEVVRGEGHLDLGAIPASVPEERDDRRVSGLGRAKVKPSQITRLGEGKRNSGLTSIAGALLNAGLDFDELVEALYERNARICDPPLEREEVERIAESVFGRYEGRDPAAEVAEEGESGKPEEPAEEWNNGPLQIGSENEIADYLLETVLEPDRNVPLVADRDRIWRYEDDLGVWREVPKSELVDAITPLDGEKIGPKGKSKLKVSSSLVSGVWEMIRLKRDEPGFFDVEGPGVAFANGIALVDEHGSIALYPHDPDARKRYALPFDYDPNAYAPRWRRFLDEIFEGDRDAAEKQAALAQFVGACLTGQAVRFQKAFLLPGTGSNGKSTFVEIIEALFPPEARAAIPPQKLGDDYAKALLAGKAINLVTEMPDSEILAAESFKAFVSGDLVTAREIYRPPFSYRPTAGQMFACNELPGVRDFSHGFWRRWVFVRFGRRFTGAQIETDLAARIIAEELPGVAAWALKGAAELIRNGGYTIPASSRDEGDDWQLSADSVAAFIDERLELLADNKDNRKLAEPAEALFLAYRDFSQRRGQHAVGIRKFKARMTALGAVQFRDGRGCFWLARRKPKKSRGVAR